MREVIEKYGMEGMSRKELMGIIGKHIMSRKAKNIDKVKAARIVLKKKIANGWE